MWRHFWLVQITKTEFIILKTDNLNAKRPIWGRPINEVTQLWTNIDPTPHPSSFMDDPYVVSQKIFVENKSWIKFELIIKQNKNIWI